jgi:hypothetical protein
MYTYTLSESACGPNYVASEWRTAFVRGTAYPGNTATYDIVEPSAILTVAFTFSDLLLTDLLPGDYITMVH